MYQDKLIHQTLNFETGPVEVVQVLKKTANASILLGKDPEDIPKVLKYIQFYNSSAKEAFMIEFTMLKLLAGNPSLITLSDQLQIPAEYPIGVLKLEYCSNGDLRDFASKHGISPPQAAYIVKEVLIGLAKLQEMGIAHRDICPENILVSENHEFKISDFGSAVRIEELLKFDPVVTIGNIEKKSNPLYRPPGSDLYKFDMYGLGCVYFFLLTKRQYTSSESLSSFPDFEKNLLSACLDLNHESRISVREALGRFGNIRPQSWVPESQQISLFKKTTLSSLQACLEINSKCPDMYHLQYLIEKSWNVPTTINKIYSFLTNTERFHSVKCIKILIVIHRLLISGPLEGLIMTPGPRTVLETMLTEWTNKIKHFQDEYFCEYFSGLIRQMCRILADKVNIHFKTSTHGNWKETIRAEYVQCTIDYLNKALRVCEGLVMGLTELEALMNFLTMQLVEECQRLVLLLANMLHAEIENNSNVGNMVKEAMRRKDEVNAKLSEKISGQIQKKDRYNTQNVAQERKPQAEPNPERKQVQEPRAPEFPELPHVQNQVLAMPSPQPKVNDIIGQRWLIKPEELKLLSVLGSGASCTVYRGMFKWTPVAVKVVRSGQMGQNLEKEFEREVRAMLILRHPNLVLFMGACKEPQMIIVSEFCSGESLFKLLHERRTVMISWAQRIKMIKDVARGMLYLHEVEPPILHRDLKSLNLLLSEEIRGPNDRVSIKITDFGVARILDSSDPTMTGQMGTCHWMAPEVLSSQPYSLAADVYSFGIVVYEIVTREIPYRNISQVAIPMSVLKGERPNLSAVPSNCPSIVKELMRACWQHNPRQRPTFAKILEELDKIDETRL